MTVKLSTMTGRERVLAAMRREPVDYVPCSPLANPLSEVQRRDRPWNFPWAEPGDGIEYLATELGTDPVVGLWWMDGMYPDERVTSRVWQEGEVLHKSFDTPAGHLHASVVVNELWPFGENIPFFHDFVAHYREPWLETRDDVECLKHVLLPPRSSDQIEDMRERIAPRKELADGKSFWTGPSNTFHMYESTDVVRQAVRDVFDAFGKTGLIVTAPSSVHPMMPWENTLAMIDEWRTHREI